MIDPAGALSVPIEDEGISPVTLEIGDDGEAVIVDDTDGPRETEAFYDNLLDIIPPSQLAEFTTSLLERIENDIQSNRKWRDFYAKGIKELGFDRSTDTKDEPFPGASALIHPGLGMACVDFQSRAMPELFPSKGPVRTAIIGHVTPQKEQQADRVREHMNYQVLQEMKGYREDFAAMLLQLPVAGCTFRKIYRDEVEKRNVSEFVLPEDLVANYGATSVHDAQRLTHIQRVHTNEMERRLAVGIYADPPIGYADMQTDRARDASDRTEGVEPIDLGDEWHVIYECHAYIMLEWEDPEAGEMVGLPLPYIVTIDKDSQTPLSIRRNWKRGDPKARARQYFVKYGMFPWRGFYDIGFTHVIGCLGVAQTAAIRSLLDSALQSQAGGGFRLKGVDGGTKNPAPGEWVEVDTAVDDIRKLLLPNPQPGPNPVMFQLLGFLGELQSRFASVASHVAAESNQNAPVGTTYALLEEGSKQFAAIYSGLHNSLTEELQILAELNGESMDDQTTARTHGGEIVVYRADYGDEIDILPVSDPLVFSYAQRIAKDQAVSQLATQVFPELGWDRLAIAKRTLADMNIADVEELLPPPPEAQPLDPVSEIAAMVQGAPVKAFPGQDHDAHVAFLMSVGQDPKYQMLMPMIGPRMQALVADHLVMAMQDEMGAAMQSQGMIPQNPQQVAMIVAKIEGDLAAGRAAKMQQGGQPGTDPALVQVAAADIQRKARADEMKVQAGMAETEAKIASAERVEMIKQAGETQRQRMKDEAESARQYDEDMRDIALGQAGAEVKVST